MKDYEHVKAVVFGLYPIAANKRVFNDKRQTFRRLKFTALTATPEMLVSVENALTEANISFKKVGHTKENGCKYYSHLKLTVVLDI